MSDEADRILSDYIDDWNAGRRPRLEDFLARAAPDQRDSLADEIAGFVAMAPEPDWQPDALEAVRAEAADLVSLPSALSAWRRRARLTLDQLGAGLARAVGVRDEEKTTRYLGKLESGSLDPGGVSRTVLARLATLLGVGEQDLEALATPWPPAPAAAPAMWRAAPKAALQEREDLELLAGALGQEPWDEVDELFLGGR